MLQWQASCWRVTKQAITYPYVGGLWRGSEGVGKRGHWSHVWHELAELLAKAAILPLRIHCVTGVLLQALQQSAHLRLAAVCVLQLRKSGRWLMYGKECRFHSRHCVQQCTVIRLSSGRAKTLRPLHSVTASARPFGVIATVTCAAVAAH